MTSQNSDSDTARRAKQIALLTSIPFALLLGPIIGYYFGTTVDRWCSSYPWGMGFGLFFGLAAGIRTVIQFIEQSNRLDEKHDQ